MGKLVENLDKGLNVANPPQLLEPGELTLALNAIYINTRSTINHAPFFMDGGQVNSGQEIRGLLGLSYSNGNNFLFAVTSLNSARSTLAIRTAPITTAAASQTWTTQTASWLGLASNGSASTVSLSAAQYGDNQFIFGGAGTANTVVEAPTVSGTLGVIRRMGMNPVTAAPGGLVTDSGTTTGNWFLTGDAVPTYYEWWVTEVYKPGETVVLESSTEETAVFTGYITGITSTVAIQRPAQLANSWATHWRVYRSVSKTAAGDQAYPNGTLVSVDIPIATLAFTDGSTTATVYGDGTTASTYAGTITSVANLVGVGSATFSLADSIPYPTLAQGFTTAKIYGFPHSGALDAISGIEVTCDGMRIYNHGTTTFPGSQPGAVSVGITLGVDHGGGVYSYYPESPFPSSYITPKWASIFFTEGAGPITKTIGGATEMWGRTTWTLAEVTTPTFFLLVSTDAPQQGYDLLMDHVQVKFYYANSNPTLTGDPFPAISLTLAGQSTLAGQNFPPPVASTGAVFNDSMICNDISEPTVIRWSVPGSVEYFPREYFMQLETHDNAPITCIRSYGGICLIGTTTSLWRLNYVPTVDDVRFVKGPAVTLIDPNNGIVGSQAASEFVDHTGRPALAFMSYRGLRATDGYSSRLLTDNLNWADLITPIDSSLVYGLTAYFDAHKKVYVVNNPDNEELIVLFAGVIYDIAAWGSLDSFSSTDGPAYTCLFHFNYGTKHIDQEGQLKVGGPVLSSYIRFIAGRLDLVWPNNIVVFRSTTVIPGATTAICMGMEGLVPTLTTTTDTYTGLSGMIRWYPPYALETTYTGRGLWAPQMQVQSRPIFANEYSGEWRVKEVYMGPGNSESGTLTLKPWNQGVAPANGVSKAKTFAPSGWALTKVIFDNRQQGAQFRIDLDDTNTTTSGIGFLAITGEDFGREDR
jgi:hypothetical protein